MVESELVANNLHGDWPLSIDGARPVASADQLWILADAAVRGNGARPETESLTCTHQHVRTIMLRESSSCASAAETR